MRNRRPQKGDAPGGRSPEASSDTTNVKEESIVRDSTQAGASRVITAPFHGAQLYVVEHEGQPYAPMKPIVMAMGLDWGSQFRKVAANEARWGVVNLTIPSEGGAQSMACLPVRKIAAWLTTIEPGKVKKPEVRARVIQYQNECDDALWKYWNDGVAVRSPKEDGNKRSNIQDRLPLYHFAVEAMVKHRLMFSKVYAFLNLYAGSLSFREMTKAQSAEVADFCDRFMLGQDTRNDWQRITDNQAKLHGESPQLDMVQKLLLS